MRITNSILLRGYNRNLSKLLTEKNKLENKITSTRQFSRASENPINAAKALKVRKSLAYNEQWKENLKTANKFYTEAETSLLQVSEKMAEVRETLIAACNTTKDSDEYNIYAQQLETYAKELITIFNTDSAERAIFGGESNDPSPFTFTTDSDGFVSTVLYHGVPVNAMDNPSGFPYSNPVNVDVGLGMVVDQKTQVVDPQSVLDISFNGAKVTGCGADKGTADVDLNSIKEGRKYCLDVYAGGIKKTIEFTGKDTRENTITEVNNALAEAYKKEVVYDKIKQPKMDDQGVIYSEGSIVCAVNNEFHKTAEKLSVENDAGYTDKFKLNFDALVENQEYSIDVTMGEITKTIKFVADNDTDTETRKENTINAIQAALTEAFGEDENGHSLVNISKSPVTKGTFSAEGVKVTVADSMKMTGSGEVKGAEVISNHYDQIELVKFNKGTNYTVKVDGKEVSFTGGETPEETAKNLQTAIGNAGVTGTVSVPAGDKKSVNIKNGDNYVKITQAAESTTSTAVKPTKGAEYKVDFNSLNDNTEYQIKVVYNNRAKIITFTKGKDDTETQSNIQGELANAFGTSGVKNKVVIDDQGYITAYDGNPVAVTSIKTGADKDPAVAQRETIYSNNYLQLTVDAARALRNGDIDYANGCIDKIVSANQNLLITIADLGCNEDFIDFNIEKLTTREQNLDERQNDLEIIDSAKAITLWKTYEALYNACLQMSSSVVPNSIFNYMK